VHSKWSMSPLNPPYLPSLLFPSPPSPPLIGSYIWLTQSGHRVIIRWHCFCS
jgi:hypothetical protein